MSFDSDHIHIIGRYRQGQHTLMTSRSQGQSQGHEGYFRFFADFVCIREFLIALMALLCILDRGIQICCDLLSTLLDVADPISLDVLVTSGQGFFTPRQGGPGNFFTHSVGGAKIFSQRVFTKSV